MNKYGSALITVALLVNFAPSVLAADAMTVNLVQGNPAQEYARMQHLMTEFYDGDFHGELQVSRVDFVVGTVDLLYKQDAAEECFKNIAPKPPVRYDYLFSDVHKDLWYAGQVCIGMFTGIVNGDRDGYFRPHRGITVAEASKILAKAYGLVYPPQNPTGHPWYEAPMHAMRLQGAIRPNMKPSHILNRQEVADMFFALRNTRRFPLERVVGQKTPSKNSASSPTELEPDPQFALKTAEVASVTDIQVSTAAETDTGTFTVFETETLGPAHTRRAPRISRRTLLTQLKNQ